MAGVGEADAVTLGIPEGPRLLGSPARECPVKRTLHVLSRLELPHQPCGTMVTLGSHVLEPEPQ